MKNILKLWLLPLLISLGLFWILRPVLIRVVAGRTTGIEDYLQKGNVEVGSEVVDGFSTVYYVFNGERVHVSPRGINSKQESSGGEYIVWIAETGDAPGQVFLYNILTGSTTQLTFSGTNANPKTSEEGNVVWEGWVDSKVPPSQGYGEARWQIFFFNGIKNVQLTFGDMSFNPEIDGDYITYTRRDIAGTYRSVVYSIKRGEERDISTGISSKYPKVKDGKILLGGDGSETEFELTVEDLFTLDLIPLTSTESAEIVRDNFPEVFTVNDILQELEATKAGEI